MELLLVDDVPGLGDKGEIVTVARGYARNYLLPQGKARVPAPDLIEAIRKQAAKAQAEKAALRAERMEVAKKMATVALSIPAKASEEGHLYGSVGTRQIVDALAAEGYEVEERQVHLEQPLKEVGEYDVMIALHPEVQVPVRVTVAAEAE